MIKPPLRVMIKLLLLVIVALCVVVGAFCPFGFWAAFEPGQERFRIIYPAVFVAAIIVGSIAERFIRKL